MTRKTIMQVTFGAAIGLAASLLSASWSTNGISAGAGAVERSGADSMGAQEAHSQEAPGTSQPPERNKAIVELEKKIAGQENKPAEEVFKNIRILKGQPAIRVLRVMEMGFSPALGVKCMYCHIPDQWDKDDKKHKQVARKMWAMTMDLNKQVKEMVDEKSALNCYTCHRGQKEPALNPTATK